MIDAATKQILRECAEAKPTGVPPWDWPLTPIQQLCAVVLTLTDEVERLRSGRDQAGA